MKVTITFDFNLDLYNEEGEEPATLDEAITDVMTEFNQVYKPNTIITNMTATHE